MIRHILEIDNIHHLNNHAIKINYIIFSEGTSANSVQAYHNSEIVNEVMVITKRPMLNPDCACNKRILVSDHIKIIDVTSF